MPFDWREFLIFAHGLRNESSEAVLRVCLGRMYYYVYNHGLTNARKLNFTEKMPSLHSKLWTWCQNQNDPDIKKIGVTGRRMHSLRIDADYKDSSIPNLAKEVEIQLQRAQMFEALVAKVTKTSPPPPLMT